MRHSCNLQSGYPMGPDDVMFSSMPFFWIGGLVTTLFEVLHLGATLVTLSSFDAGDRARPHRAGARHHRHRLAATGQDDVGAPVVPGTRPVVGGADEHARPRAARPSTARGELDLARHDGDVQLAHPVGPVRPAPRIAPRARSAGRCPGSATRWWTPRPAWSCRPVRTVSSGCAATRSCRGCTRREREDVFEPDGWYRTGDAGHFDADGWFYFTGRLGEMIKTPGGANVTPAEVEAALDGLPGRARGVRHRDPGRGRWPPGRRRGGAARRARARRRRAARPAPGPTCRRTRCRSTSGCAPSPTCRSCSRARSRSRSWPSSSRRASHRERARRRRDRRRRGVGRRRRTPPGACGPPRRVPRAGRLARTGTTIPAPAPTGSSWRGSSGRRRPTCAPARPTTPWTSTTPTWCSATSTASAGARSCTTRCGRACCRPTSAPAPTSGSATTGRCRTRSSLPHYEETDRQFGVSGLGGNPAYPPGADPPLPPLPIGRAGLALARAHARLGWHWWPENNAILSATRDGRHACVQRGTCGSGCNEGAKGSTDVTHWPGALAAGAQLRHRRARAADRDRPRAVGARGADVARCRRA